MVGQTYADAKSELESAGFYVSLSSGSSASGTVTYQSITSKAEKGTTITLTTASSSGSDTDTDSKGTDSGNTDSSTTDTTRSTTTR